MTTPSTFGPVYPAIDASGVSLTVYAEDGVTLIPAVGAIVPYAKYYLDLVFVTAKLRTSDPLGLSGDPITIPAVSRISAGLVTLTTADLAATASLTGQSLETVGNLDEDDGAGDVFTAIGNTGTVDDYRVIPGSSGNWQRAIDRGRVNLKRFGLRDMTTGTPDNLAAIASFIDWAESSTGTSGTVERKCVGFVPASKYPFYVSDAVTIPATNHHDVRFEGESAYTASRDQYDNDVWEDPTTVGGSVFFAPGTDVFRLENDGIDTATHYHRLFLRGVGLQTYGTGICINMKVPAVGEWQSGLVQLDNVTLCGGKVGWSIASYEKSSSFNVRIYGCETALRLGSTYESGVNIHEIFGLDIQACGDALDIRKILHSFLIKGANFQSISNALFKAGAGAGGLGLVVENMRAEVYAKWLDLHPSLGQMGVVIRDSSLSSQNGSDAITGPAVVYGSGWTFDRVNDTSTISFEGAADQDTIFRDCIPGSTNQSSAPTHFWSVNADNVIYRQNNASMGAGTLTPAWPQGFITREISGNITVAVPTGGYVIGKEYKISLYQGGAGGYTVTWAAGWHGDAAYSNAGNVAGTRCWIYWTLQINGEPYITKVTNWVADA